MQATPDRVINLSTLVSDLHRDGLLTEDDHQLALTIRRGTDEAALHPLTLIARQRSAARIMAPNINLGTAFSPKALGMIE